MRLLPLVAAVALSLGAAAHVHADDAPPHKRVAVRAAHLVDVKAGTVRDNPLVIIEDERITEVRYDGQVPTGVEVIDLGSASAGILCVLICGRKFSPCASM